MDFCGGTRISDKPSQLHGFPPVHRTINLADATQRISRGPHQACVRILLATGAVPNVAAALAKLVAAAVGPPLVAVGAVCTPFAGTVFRPLATPS